MKCIDVQPTLTTFTKRAPPRRLYACPFDYQNTQEGAVSTVYVDRKATDRAAVLLTCSAIGESQDVPNDITKSRTRTISEKLKEPDDYISHFKCIERLLFRSAP